MYLKFYKNYIDYYQKYITINKSPFINSIFLILLMINNVQSLSNKPIDPIIWSTQNKMFSTDKSVKKDHLIEVRIGEFLNIICPKYSSNTQDNIHKPEYHILYKVTKKEYDECNIENIESKSPILKCDRPYDNVKYTMYISKFSPVPDAIEFTPGSSYYFISTSNGSINGLLNSDGGTCLTNNMKLIVKVLDPYQASSTKKNKNYSLKKLTNTIQPISKFYNLNNVELQTRNVDPYSMKIISGIVDPRTVTLVPSLATTKLTTTTVVSSSKTVEESIFILEPETMDYQDILSQLISTSSAYNSEHLNDKQLNQEPIEYVINKSRSSLKFDYKFFFTNFYILLFFFVFKI